MVASWPDTSEQDLLECEQLKPQPVDTDSTIFPNVTDFANFVEIGEFDEGTFQALMAGTPQRVYVWGRVDYRTFDAPHFTNFCMAFGGHATNCGFTLTSFHNDGD